MAEVAYESQIVLGYILQCVDVHCACAQMLNVCVDSWPHDICSFLPMKPALHHTRLIDNWQEKDIKCVSSEKLSTKRVERPATMLRAEVRLIIT